jgi:hypothetical protein
MPIACGRDEHRSLRGGAECRQRQQARRGADRASKQTRAGEHRDAREERDRKHERPAAELVVKQALAPQEDRARFDQGYRRGGDRADRHRRDQQTPAMHDRDQQQRDEELPRRDRGSPLARDAGQEARDDDEPEPADEAGAGHGAHGGPPAARCHAKAEHRHRDQRDEEGGFDASGQRHEEGPSRRDGRVQRGEARVPALRGDEACEQVGVGHAETAGRWKVPRVAGAGSDSSVALEVVRPDRPARPRKRRRRRRRCQ